MRELLVRLLECPLLGKPFPLHFAHNICSAPKEQTANSHSSPDHVTHDTLSTGPPELFSVHAAQLLAGNFTWRTPDEPRS